MILRDAERKDAEQLDRLLARLIRDESQYDANLNGECEIRENYGSRIGLEGHKLILAEEDGEIIGYLYGFLYHIPGIYKSATAIVDALFVDEKYRRRGCASMLIDAFRSFAAENGACRIELKVMSENQNAVDLYKKLAFTETKKYMKLEL